MDKRIKKEIIIWTTLISLTLVGTNFISMRNEKIKAQADKRLAEVYEQSYNATVEAEKLFKNKNYMLVQKKIDEGRKNILELKKLVGNETQQSIEGNTWSVMLDNTQEGLFNVVNDKINKYKGNTNKEELRKEILDITNTLKQSSDENIKRKAEKIEI